MPYFKTNDGCSIYFETHSLESSKQVIIFLNGTMQDTLYWRSCTSFLKEKFGLLLYDARAQGQSDLGNRRLSLQLHASDLNTLVNHLNIEKVNLVGISHGARVALAYTANSPDRVNGLVLCSIGTKLTCRGSLILKTCLEILKNSGIEAIAWASLPFAFGENFLKQKKRILSDIVKAIVKRNREESLIAHLEAMASYPPLSSIAIDFIKPCLVLSGSDDPFISEEEAKELAVLCGGQHKHIIGAGHSIPAEVPELFAQNLLEFLS
jgi:pimeloyl-ACP methyl ester carboxylesterase